MPSGRSSRGRSKAHAVRDPPPLLSLPDLDDTLIDLARFRGQSVLVLFWNPGCGFCQHMLDDLRVWERAPAANRPALLVVSQGTHEINRAMQLRSPVVLDNQGIVMGAFGATGTPMAVLVDDAGRIASPLAAGADNVMALARSRSGSVGRRAAVSRVRSGGPP